MDAKAGRIISRDDFGRRQRKLVPAEALHAELASSRDESDRRRGKLLSTKSLHAELPSAGATGPVGQGELTSAAVVDARLGGSLEAEAEAEAATGDAIRKRRGHLPLRLPGARGVGRAKELLEAGDARLPTPSATETPGSRAEAPDPDIVATAQSSMSSAGEETMRIPPEGGMGGRRGRNGGKGAGANAILVQTQIRVIGQIAGQSRQGFGRKIQRLSPKPPHVSDGLTRAGTLRGLRGRRPPPRLHHRQLPGRASAAGQEGPFRARGGVAPRSREITYRNGCDELETCVADYDPREGIVLAAMGAKDVIAGSTATMCAVSVSEDGADELAVLNCGDSRTLVVGRPREGTSKDSVVHFSTRDHSPSCEVEIERLSRGKDKGYSQPQCSMGRWRIKVGDFQYGLARSLEGSFTTSKGITSEPDVSAVNLSETLAERELVTLILASDGLFEVIDNEEAGRIATACREEGLEASLAAKQLCLKAIDKGSPDNVSVVVVYLND
ncbi:hypothetical protein ACHAXT_001697 [Thalassiosira profunda]